MIVNGTCCVKYVEEPSFIRPQVPPFRRFRSPPNCYFDSQFFSEGQTAWLFLNAHPPLEGAQASREGERRRHGSSCQGERVTRRVMNPHPTACPRMRSWSGPKAKNLTLAFPRMISATTRRPTAWLLLPSSLTFARRSARRSFRY